MCEQASERVSERERIPCFQGGSRNLLTYVYFVYMYVFMFIYIYIYIYIYTHTLSMWCTYVRDLTCSKAMCCGLYYKVIIVYVQYLSVSYYHILHVYYYLYVEDLRAEAHYPELHVVVVVAVIHEQCLYYLACFFVSGYYKHLILNTLSLTLL